MDNTGSGEILLKATITKVTYQSEETGFAVVRVESTSHGNTTVIGTMPGSISAGAHIHARGSWQTHPKFGPQFKARWVDETAPTSKDAIIRYLGSGGIKGFGPVLAERVVDTFGDKALEILDKDPNRLQEVPGIGLKKLQEIKEQWESKQNVREVLLFFQNHNISMSTAQRIHRTYGDRSLETVKRNPYVLSKDIWGIGFLTADRIAQSLGFSFDDPRRVNAGINYILQRATDDGHCFLPKNLLIEKTKSLLGIDNDDAIETGIREAIVVGEMVGREEKLYPPFLDLAETSLSESISERISSSCLPEKAIDDSLVGRFASGSYTPAPGISIRLSEDQKKVLDLVAKNRLVVITGGPGCGKTTVVRAIAALFRSAGLNIKLGAPTGRAAQRLAEVCDSEASTIHRLLKFDPISRGFLHSKKEPLVLDALILDECSMIDIPLAASLMQAVPAEARMVIVGDADQLPSVGPGLFLGDLLKVNAIPRVALTQLFRREEASRITQIAHEINAAAVPNIPQPGGQARTDAYFIPQREAEQAAKLTERVVVEQIPKKFGITPKDITVLTPMNKGELGINLLNQRLQKRLVPALPGTPVVKVGDIEFRLGDRVCQRVNNYQITTNGVFNGDQGEIIGIDAEAKSLKVRLWDGREIDYPTESIPQLDLAYALTIHRSQGSEIPAVVLVLHDSHHILLERQLLYTAVTRAKKLLIVIGSKRALIVATKRMRSKRRFTDLVSKIESEFESEIGSV